MAMTIEKLVLTFQKKLNGNDNIHAVRKYFFMHMVFALSDNIPIGILTLVSVEFHRYHITVT